MPVKVEPRPGAPTWYMGNCYGGVSDNNLKSILGLLGELAEFFKDKGRTIELATLTMEHPYDKDGAYQIFFDYYELDKDVIAVLESSLSMTEAASDKKYNVEKLGDSQLFRIEIYNELPESRGDISVLLNNAIEELKKYENATVQDIFAVDYLDEDGLVNPRLRVYLSKVPSAL